MSTFQPQQQLLRPYVKQAYYHTLSPDNSSSITFVPTGNLFLALLWGSEDYYIQRPNISERMTSGSIIICGQQFEIGHLFARSGKVNTIVVELSPSAILQFFRIPQQEAAGQVLELKDLCSIEARQLLQQVVDQPDPTKQFAIIEQFLCRILLSKRKEENISIAEAISMVKQSNGNVSVPVLADAMRISTRSLERKFLHAVGISPKAYCKIIKFNHAFRQLTLYQKQILDVVYGAGYYDQSHFINHFKKVTGVSPSQFIDEQETFISSFKEDAELGTMNSLADTLTNMQKLYIF